MLPNNLVPAILPILAREETAITVEEITLSTDIHDDFAILEKTILSANDYAGQAKNSLLEENDRHLKDQLFCAVKIEAITTLLNELIEQEKVCPADLQMLIKDKEFQISQHSQQIWINQLTQEKTWPLFYSLEN
jgi:glucose-6-phosphate isomerase